MENKDLQDDLEQEVTLPEKDENLEDLDYDSAIEQLKEARKKARTLDAQRKHFRSKLEKLNSSEEKEQAVKQTPQLDNDVTKRLNSLETLETKRQFGHDHGLSPEETDLAFRFAGSGDPKEALENSFFKAGLEAQRTQQRIDNATPSSSKKSTTFEGKSWDEQSTEERAKNFSKVMSRAKKG